MSFSREISQKRIAMTGQIFSGQGNGSGSKVKRRFETKSSTCYLLLPVYPLWIGLPMESLSLAVWHI